MKNRPATQLLLMVNGALLLAMSFVQTTLALVGHFAGAGPLASHLTTPLAALSWVEQFGQAGLIGAVLLWGARRSDAASFAVVAILLHVGLGAANLVFWDAFASSGWAVVGAAATAVHFAMAAAYMVCLHVVGQRWPLG